MSKESLLLKETLPLLYAMKYERTANPDSWSRINDLIGKIEKVIYD